MANGLRIFVGGVTSITNVEDSHMPLCGYNSSMAAGTMKFTGGLAVQTRKRAVAEGVPVAEVLGMELEEISALLEKLDSSPKKEALSGVRAVGMLIGFFYSTLALELRSNPTLSVEDGLEKIVEELNHHLFAMEEYYYKNLRPNFPRIEAVCRIADFLEEQVS